jgi:hypothetical protein
LYTYLPKLLPAGFNSPDQLARLPPPDGRISLATAVMAAVEARKAGDPLM